ncbi:MAG: hypothetical protein KAJ96_09365, partial [Candidatus Thorarchaeota archaeon]|nr:hypothetical protein [Candidatus Thorarchaeota archaeon]
SPIHSGIVLDLTSPGVCPSCPDSPSLIGFDPMNDEHYPKVKRALDETIRKIKKLVFPTFGLE